MNLIIIRSGKNLNFEFNKIGITVYLKDILKMVKSYSILFLATVRNILTAANIICRFYNLF